MIRHLPFMEAMLATEEGSKEWHALTAGFVTLRLLDAWLDDTSCVIQDDARGLQAVSDAVADMDAGNPAQRILADLVAHVRRDRRAHIDAIAPQLCAYGRALDYEGRWALAADVFEMVLAQARAAEPGSVDPVLIIDASLEAAYAYRTSGRWDEAIAAYTQAGTAAAAADDRERQLRSEVGQALVALNRGNLPLAQEILDEVIATAERRGCNGVLYIALGDRGRVAYARGAYIEAITYLYRAYSNIEDAIERDHALADMAGAFAQLGARGVARDAYLVLEVTAQEQWVRWQAALNLLEIAALDRNEPQFERYRRQLQGEPLPPLVAAHYEYTVGRGYHQFDNHVAAMAALQRSAAIAAEHSLHQLTFDIDRAVSALKFERSRSPEATSPAEVSPAATAIYDLRRRVGV